MKPIELNKKYRPMEIVDNGWITGNTDNRDVNYRYVLDLIDKGNGPLNAIDYSRPSVDRPAYYVWGYEIARFLREERGETPIVADDEEHS